MKVGDVVIVNCSCRYCTLNNLSGQRGVIIREPNKAGVVLVDIGVRYILMRITSLISVDHNIEVV